MRRFGFAGLRKRMPLQPAGGAIRRFFSINGRRLAVLWRSLASPRRRVRLPKRSVV